MRPIALCTALSTALSLAVPMMVLGACSPPQSSAEPEPAPASPPVLAGVDLTQPLRALGTEPGWALDVGSTELAIEGMDRPLQQAPRPDPVVHGTTATFTTATEAGVPLVLTLIATDCSDGMTDRTYPLVARVEFGVETLTGCAAATEAIMSVGESGRVERSPAAPETPAKP